MEARIGDEKEHGGVVSPFGDLFKLLSEPKRLTLYDGGHVPSLEVVMSTISGWLEEQLGRVVR